MAKTTTATAGTIWGGVSDDVTWNNGVPDNGDTVYVGNGITLNIQGNIPSLAVLSPTPTAGTGKLTITMTADRTITANTIQAYDSGSSGQFLTVTGSDPSKTLTINGNIVGSSFGSSSRFVIRLSSSSVVNITGDITGGSANSCYAIVNTDGGTLTVTGSITAGNNDYAYGVINNSVLIITGNVTGGDRTLAWAINNTASGTITLTGNVSSGTGTNVVAIRTLATTEDIVIDGTVEQDSITPWDKWTQYAPVTTAEVEQDEYWNF